MLALHLALSVVQLVLRGKTDGNLIASAYIIKNIYVISLCTLFAAKRVRPSTSLNRTVHTPQLAHKSQIYVSECSGVNLDWFPALQLLKNRASQRIKKYSFTALG